MMKGCDRYSAATQSYLDRELRSPDREDFLAHLQKCKECRARLEAEEKLSALLHRSRPLYLSPDAMRQRITHAAEAFHAVVAHEADPRVDR
jgi:predicted anti-sigma-YlaC factor YlaD